MVVSLESEKREGRQRDIQEVVQVILHAVARRRIGVEGGRICAVSLSHIISKPAAAFGFPQ